MTIAGATTRETPRFDDEARAYDALLVLSFGGPEAPDDVRPFLENVLRGRKVPPGRVDEVAHHYLHFGGKSPINDQNRALIAALEQDLRQHGIELPIYFGNRNWHPFLADTVCRMREAGVRRALVLATSGFSSYSGCRQYREDVIRACETVGPATPTFDKLRVFYNHPGYIAACADRLSEGLAQLPAAARTGAVVVFTAHSIPMAMARHSAYPAQLTECAGLVAQAAGVARWQIAFQSRSGSPQTPWLEPDILATLDALQHAGAPGVVVQPIGFQSDHMEVVYDLDVEAAERARELGLPYVRAGTAGTHPEFVGMIRQLIQERMVAHPTRLALGTRGPAHDICPLNCCQIE